MVPWPELVVALMSGVIFVLAHFPALTNPFIINDDVRQQLFWMQQWQDPALFRGDFLTGYARHYVPWGVKALYWVASWFVAPLYFAKVLPGLLFVFLAVCLFKIGTHLSNRRLGWTMVAVYLAHAFLPGQPGRGPGPVLRRPAPGPLLAGLAGGASLGHGHGAPAPGPVHSLYLPGSGPGGPAGLALGALWAGTTRHLSRLMPPTFCLLGLGAALVIAMNLQFSADGYGPLVKAREMVNHPEFYAHGRYQILPEPSLLWDLASPWEFIAAVSGMGAGGRRPGLCGAAALVAAGFRRLDWPPGGNASSPPGTWLWPPWSCIA